MKARNIGIIEGVLVGRDNVNITHLQYADDTLIFSLVKEQNIQNIQSILDCFTIMSGLSINYSKTALIPIYCNEDWALKWRILYCASLQSFPFLIYAFL